MANRLQRRKICRESPPPGLTNAPVGGYNRYCCYAAVVQRLVHQPSKLRTWVRLPSAAPKRDPCVVSRRRGLFWDSGMRSRTRRRHRSAGANSPADCPPARGRRTSAALENSLCHIPAWGVLLIMPAKNSEICLTISSPAGWRFLLFTTNLSVTVLKPIWKVNVKRIASPPFGKCG